MKNSRTHRGKRHNGYSEAPNDLVLDNEVVTPGAQVEATDGVVGRVERLVGGRGNVVGSMIVRAANGRSLDIGTNLVARIVPDQLAPHVLLSVTRAELGLGGAKKRRQRAASKGADASAPTATGSNAIVAATTHEPIDGADVTLPVAEERLITSTQWKERGRVRVRKRVRYDDSRQIVPLSFEEVKVEHLSPDLYDANAPHDPDELVIPILEERLIVRKETVVKEYVRVRKQTRSKQYEVRAQLRREVVQLDEAADPAWQGEALPLMGNSIDAATESGPAGH